MKKKSTSTSDMWERLLNISSDAPYYSDQINPLISSLDGLINSSDRKSKIDHILSALTQLNNLQLKKEDNPTISEAPNITGNHVYDIFNSPAMQNIVKEVLKHKKKR